MKPIKEKTSNIEENPRGRDTKQSKPQNRGKGSRNKSYYNRESTKGKNTDLKSSIKSHNDPSWYVAANQLTKDVASFSFNNATGAIFKLQPFGNVGNTSVISMTLPGIAVIHNAPCIGKSTGAVDDTAPVNIAANKLYTFVRHQNSGHSNYDANDLMMYLLAMDSVYTFYAWMRRVYGLCNTWQHDNRYVGDALIEACGVDPNNIRANLANFRAFINMYAVKANAFAVPAVMTYFTRHSWMYESVYKDENVRKAQFYMYNPAYLYSYEYDSVTGVPFLEPRELGCIKGDDGHMVRRVLEMDYNDIVLYGTTLLSKITQQEDLAIMSGDVLKAYGDGALFKLREVLPEHFVLPVFDEEVLVQIHNTNFTGAYPVVMEESDFHYGWDSLRQTGTTGIGSSYLVFNPCFDKAWRLAYTNIFDVWMDDPTPDIVLVGSRNMAAGSNRTVAQGSGTHVVTDIDSCGSELCFFMSIYKYSASDGTMTATDFYEQNQIGAVATRTDQLYRFNEYPHVLAIDANMTPALYYGELSNYITMDRNNLNNLHTSALLAMFNVG